MREAFQCKIKTSCSYLDNILCSIPVGVLYLPEKHQNQTKPNQQQIYTTLKHTTLTTPKQPQGWKVHFQISQCKTTDTNLTWLSTNLTPFLQNFQTSPVQSFPLKTASFGIIYKVAYFWHMDKPAEQKDLSCSG